MGSVISSIGTANPENRFSQLDILSFMLEAHQLNDAQASRLSNLYKASGIDHRCSVIPDFGARPGTYSFFGNEPGLQPFPGTKSRSALFEKSAKVVAAAAVHDLFKKTSYRGEDITHLITISCTGMYAPGLDIDLVEILNLRENVERTCINFMGCYGAFNGLKMADYICRAEPAAKVLLVDVELCTLHFQGANTLENWVSNSLFADGAAAVLVESDRSGNVSTGLLPQTFYNTLVSEAKDEMAWRIGDTGFEMKLSSQIAKNIGRKINVVSHNLLKKAGLSESAVNSFAIHPGGRRILEVCEEMLELPEEALQYSYDTLRRYGNMSSVTILFILKQMLEKTASGEKIMSFAFGPGLTVESMILEVI